MAFAISGESEALKKAVGELIRPVERPPSGTLKSIRWRGYFYTVDNQDHAWFELRFFEEDRVPDFLRALSSQLDELIVQEVRLDLRALDRLEDQDSDDPLPEHTWSADRYRFVSGTKEMIDDGGDQPLHLAGDAYETLDHELHERLEPVSELVYESEIAGELHLESPFESLSPRLAQLARQIQDAGRFQKVFFSGRAMVKIPTGDGHRMSAVSDEELEALASATGITPEH